eukprot:806036-Rhodomonas_salina.1
MKDDCTQQARSPASCIRDNHNNQRSSRQCSSSPSQRSSRQCSSSPDLTAPSLLSNVLTAA